MKKKIIKEMEALKNEEDNGRIERAWNGAIEACIEAVQRVYDDDALKKSLQKANK